MALGKCRECGSDVSSEAKNCPRCGVPKPLGGKKSRVFLWSSLIFIMIIVALLAISSNGPNTYGDLAKIEAKNCMRDNGYGKWQASMGISLENFCKASASIYILEKHKKAYPEQY